jgi:3-oxoacyl-[acyl-carrier-protein] synthase II
MRRVAVTGLGVVAPNGIGKDEFWDACVNGRSGVREISAFDASSFPVRIAGEVRDFDPSPFIPDSMRKSLKVMGRAARFGVGAAGLALQDSGISMENENAERVGVVVGADIVSVDMAGSPRSDIMGDFDEGRRGAVPDGRCENRRRE